VLERVVERPRHGEIQILGDGHGNVVHLFERECSVQRRHQKVVEEAPSTALTPQLRKAMGDAAVAAGRAIGYANAGTVEFVLAPDGEFAFLEVNTRLQVEHPVTELTAGIRPADGSAGGPGAGWAGIDLVRLQLLIAQGEPLPFAQDDLVQRGHAIEVRLYAEDPANDHLPATGTLHTFSPGSLPGVRWDAGVATGSIVSPHYDPLLAKVIARGDTREEAARLLARALDTTVVHGVETNRALLAAILRDGTFLAGDTTTAFLDERFPAGRREFPPTGDAVRMGAVAAALAGERERRSEAAVLRTIPSGWRNSRGHDQRVRFTAGAGEAGRTVEVHYRRERGGSWAVRVDGEPVAVRRFGDELEVDGRRFRPVLSTADDPATASRECHVLTPAGQVTLSEVPRFPHAGLEAVSGATLAPMPGSVVEVAVSEGDGVVAGALLVVVEAMKMEHRITAPQDGTVAEVRVAAGDQVDAGTVLVVVEDS
ncbi:MAG: biotin/lipoyl-containing protein, partial [Nitriliruptorales bacterium]